MFFPIVCILKFIRRIFLLIVELQQIYCECSVDLDMNWIKNRLIGRLKS